jgi:hypothetical protein
VEIVMSALPPEPPTAPLQPPPPAAAGSPTGPSGAQGVSTGVPITGAGGPSADAPPGAAPPAELEHRRHVPHAGPILVGAGLGVLLVVLGLPTLVLVWRSALSTTISPQGLVGGLLVLVGLVLLTAGGAPMLLNARRIERDAVAGQWASVLLRPSVLVVLAGVVLLICAAVAVT